MKYSSVLSEFIAQQFDENIFKGPLDQQLRGALLYIRNSVIKERVIKQPGRAEADRFFNYPYEAIEEALANAVYHKGYDIREPIEVRVEKDRIEIVSFPGPDRSVTVEGLKEFNVFNRRYRNRRIGDFLKELQLTEGRNTGIRKILRALEKNGSPLPEFETDENRDYFVTRLFIHPGFKEKNQVTNHVIIANGDDNGDDNGDETKVLDLLRIEPAITARRMSEKLEVSPRKISRIIKSLRESGKIVRIGSDRKGYWEIK